MDDHSVVDTPSCQRPFCPHNHGEPQALAELLREYLVQHEGNTFPLPELDRFLRKEAGHFYEETKFQRGTLKLALEYADEQSWIIYSSDTELVATFDIGAPQDFLQEVSPALDVEELIAAEMCVNYNISDHCLIMYLI